MFKDETEAEYATLPCLASNLSDGMKVLTAQNLARPVNDFVLAGHPFPDTLMGAEAFADLFLDTRSRVGTSAKRAIWMHPDAAADTLLYVYRKVWADKVANMTVKTPAGKALGTMVMLQRDYRTGVHEALNHAIKHNEDVKLLGTEIREAIDDVVKLKLTRVLEHLAGTLLELPELSAKLRLEHKHV